MKDINQIIQGLVERAKSLAPNLLWEPQSVLARLILTVPAKEFENTYIVAEYIHKLLSISEFKSVVIDESFKQKLANALRLTLSEVENLIKNDAKYLGERYNCVIKSAKPSQGVVNLYFYTSDSVSIPSNVIFRTKTGIEFVNLKDFTATPIYDSDTGLYKLPVVVRCLEEGTTGNVPAGTITDISISLPNLALVYNPYPFTNGVDEEDLVSFLERLKNSVVSNALGSKSWLENFFLSDENVLDACVLAGDDKGFVRRYGAEVWVVDYEELEEYVENVDELYVDLPPVVYYENATLYRRPPEQDVYSYSIYGVERLNRINSEQSIRYKIDKTIFYLQQKILYPEWYFLAGERNIVVRKAISANVYIYVEVYPTSPASLTFSELKQQILSDLNVFFTGGITSYGEKYTRKKIGKSIDVSDLVDVIIDNPNVDRVDLDKLVVKVEPDREAQYGVLELKVYEYPVLSPNSVVVIK